MCVTREHGQRLLYEPDTNDRGGGKKSLNPSLGITDTSGYEKVNNLIFNSFLLFVILFRPCGHFLR